MILFIFIGYRAKDSGFEVQGSGFRVQTYELDV
jgi:hypothetical protein